MNPTSFQCFSESLIVPESILFFPNMHLSNVVLPQPLGPRSPYLKNIFKVGPRG